VTFFSHKVGKHMSWRSNSRGLTWQSGDVATRAIVLVNVVTFILLFLHVPGLAKVMAFDPDHWWARPWTLLTYPLISPEANPLFLFILCYWMWVVGGSVERSWSTGYFLRFFFIIAAASAIGVWLGTLTTREPTLLAGLFLPLSAITVVWCYLNPGAVVYLFFVFPVQARHLAWITMAFVVFFYGRSHPLNGLFALSGSLIALWWARGVPWSRLFATAPNRTGRVYENTRSLNPFEAIARWRRKRQFRRLWRESGLPEDDTEIPPR
jgi:membrane associated rhomboid family serine protease